MEGKLSHGFLVSHHKVARKDWATYLGFMGHDQLKPLRDERQFAKAEQAGLTVPQEPRSVYEVEKLYAALDAYSPKNRPRVSRNKIQRVRGLADACFSRPVDPDGVYCSELHVLPLTIDTVKEITSKPNASAGLTALGRRKAEVMEFSLDVAKRILRREKAPERCIAYKRTQKGGKTRLIWGLPYSQTILEGTVARPLTDRFKIRSGGAMAFAMPKHAVGAAIRSMSNQCEYIYSLDMSQFDASISQSLIRTAFEIIRTWFDMDEIEPVTGVKVGELFDQLEDYFIFTPIVMPDQNVYKGKSHGVPSGSYFTQIVDSIVNVILIGAISEHFNLHVKKERVMVLGDDMLFGCDKLVSLAAISAYVRKEFGVSIHADEKSRIHRSGETIHFLGKDWVNGIPYVDEPTILAHLCYPERYRQYPKDPLEAERAALQWAHAWAFESANGLEVVSKMYGLDVGDDLLLRTEIPAYGVDLILDDYADHLSGSARYTAQYIRPKTKYHRVYTPSLFFG